MSLQNIAKNVGKSIQSLTQSVYSLTFIDHNEDSDDDGCSKILTSHMQSDHDDFSLQKVPSQTLCKCSSELIGESENSVLTVNLTYLPSKSVKPILDNVSLTIPKGKIFSLLGPSGCGKTTLLRCIVGYLKPDCGEILLFNKTHQSDDLLIPGKNVGYMPQELALLEYMTISEILFYYGRIYQMSQDDVKRRISEIITQLELPPENQKIYNLSGGQQRRVSFAIALIHCPPLIILDEPTSGVDPLLREKIWTLLIETSHRSNSTIIITTHYIEEARRSDLVGFMRNGKILHQNSPINLLKTYSTLEKAFLDLCIKEDTNSLTHENQGFLKLSSTKEVTYTFDCVNSKNTLTGENTKKTEDFISSITREKKKFFCWFEIFYGLFLRYFKYDVFAFQSLVYQYLIPISQAFLVAYCVGGRVFGVSVGFVNNEFEPILSELFLSGLDHTFFNVINYTSLEDAAQDVAKNKLWAAVELRNGFTDAYLERIYGIDRVSSTAAELSNIFVITDTTTKVIFTSLVSVLDRELREFSRQVVRFMDNNDTRNMENSNFVSNWPIKIEQLIYGIHSHDYQGLRNYVFPGAIINIVFSMSYTMFAFSLMSERFSQSFERNYVAGVKSYQMLLALAASRILCMIPMFFIITILPVKMIGFPILVKDIIRSMPLILMVSLAGYSFGIIIAILCSSVVMAATFSVGTLFGLIFTSGTFWPLESLNYYLRRLLLLGPITMSVNAIRNIYYKNAPIFHGDAMKAFVIMFLWTIVALFFGIKFFRR